MNRCLLNLIVLIVSLPVYSQSLWNESVEKGAVTVLTEQYFQHIHSEKYGRAYSSVADALRQYSTKAEWIESKKDFKALAGESVSIKITRLTVYINPINTPKGIYIAADYYNSFVNLPIHCGYLVWFKQEDGSGEYKILREESGYLTKAQMSGMSKEQVVEIEKGLKCVQP